MRALVTGGAGFVGSHIVRALLARGYEVRVLDNFSTGKRGNLESILTDVELFEGDMRDYDLAQRAMQGVTLVFHEAAIPSVPRSIKDPLTSVSVNVDGTATVLKAAVDTGVKRVVYAASSSAYGNTSALVKVESLQPKPISPYAVSKLAGEYLLQAFSACYGIETVGLRYFNVFGERQDPDSAYSGVIAKFSKSMLQGIQPTIFGDGTTARDFTYVANAVQANLLAATMPFEANGAIFNVACGHSTTLNDLVHHINAFLGTHLVPNYAPNRPGDVQYSCADITLARETFGYEPEADFVSGLRKTLEWYRSTLDRADESQVNLA